MNPRALIAEDEPLLATSLGDALAEAWPELRIVHVSPDGGDALEALRALKPEIAFLDIRMPGLTGLEVATELADQLGAADPAPAIVFVTAYDEFALKAFELAAFDYVLKPVNPARLARTIERLKLRLLQPVGVESLVAQLRSMMASERQGPAAPVLRSIRAGSGNEVRLIPLGEVFYFQAADKYTRVVTRDGEELIRTPLKELLAQLPSERFQQIHRGTIVNMDEVAQAVRDDSGRIALRLRRRTETLPVSRIYAEQFRQM